MSHFCGYQKGVIDTQPPTHTHTIMSYNLVPLQCCSPALCSALCSLRKGRVPTAIKRCSAGHSQIVTRVLFPLFVLFCYFTDWAFHECLLSCSTLEKNFKRPATKGNGNNNKTWVLYSTSFLKCLRCLHIYNIFLTSLRGPKQTAHRLGSNLSGSQCS